jgi:hypothetical protein
MNIHAVFERHKSLYHVRAIPYIGTVKTVHGIFAVIKIFTKNIFIMGSVKILLGECSLKFLKFRTIFLELSPLPKPRYILFVFLFGSFCITDVILLVSQIYRENAVFTADAVFQKITVATIFRILKKKTIVAVITVYAFIAQFTFSCPIAVHAIFAAVYAIGVHRVPILIGVKDKVAILILPCVVGIW